MAPDADKLSKEALSKYYGPLSLYAEKAMGDVRWCLDNSMETSKDKNVQRIYKSSTKKQRVKPEGSLLKKCHRDNITAPESIPDIIEDVIGIRIVTSNKNEAAELFEFLRTNKDSWFCDVVGEPKFTPYTIAERNRYSILSGYQAYHITFVYQQSYHPVTDISRWPVEMQLTSLLWEFWANYSREYFYSRPGGMAEKLRPYTVAISKTLDSAEDLMATTTEILLGETQSEQGNAPEKE